MAGRCAWWNEAPVAPYDIITLAADVHAVVESVAPGELPLLVGHSIGAAVATAYAVAYPARGVINVDQRLELTSMQGGLKQAQATLRGDGFTEFITTMHESLYGDLDAGLIDRLRAIRNPKQDVVLGMWAPLLELSPANLTKWAAGTTAVPTTVPYLALHGRNPWPEYEAWLHRAIPSAQLEVRGTDTHYVHLADPTWFVARLIAFDATSTPPGGECAETAPVGTDAASWLVALDIEGTVAVTKLLVHVRGIWAAAPAEAGRRPRPRLVRRRQVPGRR